MDNCIHKEMTENVFYILKNTLHLYNFVLFYINIVTLILQIINIRFLKLAFSVCVLLFCDELRIMRWKRAVSRLQMGLTAPLMSCQGSIFIQKQGSKVVSNTRRWSFVLIILAYELPCSQRQEEGGEDRVWLSVSTWEQVCLTWSEMVRKGAVALCEFRGYHS